MDKIRCDFYLCIFYKCFHWFWYCNLYECHKSRYIGKSLPMFDAYFLYFLFFLINKKMKKGIIATTEHYFFFSISRVDQILLLIEHKKYQTAICSISNYTQIIYICGLYPTYKCFSQFFVFFFCLFVWVLK